VIAAVNSRATGGHRTRGSISASSGNVLAGLVQVGGAASLTAVPSLPTVSSSNSNMINSNNSNSNSHVRTASTSRVWKKPSIDTGYSISGGGIGLSSTSPLAREPSPSLPNLPSHPTLGSLISSSLTDTSITS